MKKKILVTGAAGFIGFHTVKKLISDSNLYVIGIDNLNEYYNVNLKKDRLDEINKININQNFIFKYCDISDQNSLNKLFLEHSIDIVINLAAQAGVRYSLTNPEAYVKSNLVGFANILEVSRNNKIQHLIYASSSSVYGKNIKLPFGEEDSVDHPISLYAASKKSNELMAHTYSHLYYLPTTGLRFFTVYGPWGRPDMAMFLFADAIYNSTPLNLFNGGDMQRDFTYVDDVTECIVRLCDIPPMELNNEDSSYPLSTAPFYRILNIGNNKPELVLNLVQKIENYFQKKAIIVNKPIQPGDVRSTYANIDKINKISGFKPNTPLEEGLNTFLNWYCWYNNIK